MSDLEGFKFDTTKYLPIGGIASDAYQKGYEAAPLAKTRGNITLEEWLEWSYKSLAEYAVTGGISHDNWVDLLTSYRSYLEDEVGLKLPKYDKKISGFR